MGNASGQPRQFDVGTMWQRWSRGDQIIIVASILLLIDSFIDAWIHVSVDCGNNSVFCNDIGGNIATMYHGWGWLVFIALLAVIVLWVVRNVLSDMVTMPDLPSSDAIIYMALGAVEILGMIFFWIEYHESSGSLGFNASQGPGWAFFVGLILAIATVVGGYLKMQEPATVAPTGGGYSAPPPASGGGYGAPPPPAGGGYSAPPPASTPPPAAPPPAAPGGGMPPSSPPPPAPPPSGGV